jgi:hypothetical protein
MSKWMRLPIVAAGVAMILRYSQQPSVTSAVIEDKTYGHLSVETDPYIDEGGEG